MSYLCLIASFEGNLETALKKLKSDFTNAKKKKKKLQGRLYSLLRGLFQLIKNLIFSVYNFLAFSIFLSSFCSFRVYV